MIKWYFTLTAALLIIACQEPKNKDLPAIKQMNNETKTTNTMELLVLPATFEQKDTNKTGKYILNNNLDQELILSSSFIIEKLTDDKWEPVPLSEMLAFPDITYAVLARKSQEFSLTLSNILKDKAIGKGRYRLVKNAWLYGQENNIKRLTAEFEIR